MLNIEVVIINAERRIKLYSSSDISLHPLLVSN